MTLADILLEIKRSCKEPSVGGHWTDTELLRRINIKTKQIVRYTGCLQKVDTSTTSVSGTQEYTKPSTCMRLTRVLFDSKKIYNIPISELDGMSAAGAISHPWTDDSGTPTHYYERIDKIGLYPNPDSAETITLEYIYSPTDLSTSTDIPFDSVTYLYDYHNLIVFGVLYDCFLEDGNEAMFQEHKKNYQQGMEDLRRQMLSKPDEMITFGLQPKHLTGDHSPIPVP